MHRPAHPGSLARWADDLARAAVDAGLASPDVLAGLAAELGVRWDGPGRAVALPAALPPSVSGAWALDAARQALLAAIDPAARRRLGAHHTPAEVARRLAAIALDLEHAPGEAHAPTRRVGGGMHDPGWLHDPASGPGPEGHASARRVGGGLHEPGGFEGAVVDPACGGGAFLLAAGEALVAAGVAPEPASLVGAGLLRGADIDPVAVATTRAALEAWSGATPPPGAVVVADALEEQWFPPRSAAAVVGNPPFLSPLTSGAPAGGAAAYTDASARFLAAAVGLCRTGGRVVLVQPESLLAARDAAPVRAAVLEAAALEGLWVAGEPVFVAGAGVCAPVLRVGGEQPRSIRRWRGADVRPASPARVDIKALATWAPLRPIDVPKVPRSSGRIGDLATATAGFRDEFYGLAAAADEALGPDDPRPRLVTSGLIDPGRVLWGERPARIKGRLYRSPVVDLDRLDGRVGAWTAARLVPKVLVATQTRLIEAAADPAGRYVPVTPVIAVVPADPTDLDRLLAALLAPAASAWALRHYGGTALSSDAVKLSARQVLDIPLPGDAAAWDAATALIAQGDVAAAAAALSQGHPKLLEWWTSRSGTRTRLGSTRS